MSCSMVLIAASNYAPNYASGASSGLHTPSHPPFSTSLWTPSLPYPPSLSLSSPLPRLRLNSCPSASPLTLLRVPVHQPLHHLFHTQCCIHLTIVAMCVEEGGDQIPLLQHTQRDTSDSCDQFVNGSFRLHEKTNQYSLICSIA